MNRLDLTNARLFSGLCNFFSRKISSSTSPCQTKLAPHVIYAVGYRSDRIKEHVSQQPNADTARFSSEHTGGASSAIRATLNEFDIIGHTALLAADTVIKGLNFADAYRFHLENKANLTLIATQASSSESHSDDTLIFEKGTTKTALIIPDTGDRLTKTVIFFRYGDPFPPRYRLY